MVRLPVIAAMMLAGASVVAAPPVMAQASAVRPDRASIEVARILSEDNVNPDRLSTAAVAARIARIRQGNAPANFWTAYSLRVAAWRQAAAAERALGDAIRQGRSNTAIAEAVDAYTAALDAISTTFSEVNEMAARYGVTPPTPVHQAAPGGPTI